MTHPRLTPPPCDTYRITNATIAATLIDAPDPRRSDGMVGLDLVVENGHISALCFDGPPQESSSLPTLDMRGGLIFPRFVDIHTHLDKGHIAPRCPNMDGTHAGARRWVQVDREANWATGDVRQRMDFALRSAYAHGTGAIRTHLDSIGSQAAISWPVFDEMRSAWKGRIALQAVALVPVEMAIDDPDQFRTLAATVARYGGLLGGLTFMGEAPGEKLAQALDVLMATADSLGIDLDFHVDESDSPNARSLEFIADAALRNKFKGTILAGHCCSLALTPSEEATRVIEKLRAADIAVVALPMVNMYLQDRTPNRTPRWRGVAPLHELNASGVTALVSSDNTRDPFHAYGDLDMLEVFREATRILHLDHSDSQWVQLLCRTPAAVMGLPHLGAVRLGGPADLVLTRARNLNELNSRPQSDRAVLVAGRAIDTTLPDYSELDQLLAPTVG